MREGKGLSREEGKELLATRVQTRVAREYLRDKMDQCTYEKRGRTY